MSGVNITVTFDRSEWLSLLRSPVGPVFRDLQLRGTAVKNKAQRLCPVAPGGGRLRTSIEVEMAVERGAPVARVGTNVEYALYVHEGTGIYGKRGRPITPVRAKALKFTVGGKTLIRRSVAGMPGRPFLTDALDAAQY